MLLQSPVFLRLTSCFVLKVHPSVYGATAPSGPWPSSKGVSIFPNPHFDPSSPVLHIPIIHSLSLEPHSLLFMSPFPSLLSVVSLTRCGCRSVWVRIGGCIGSCWGDRREGEHWGDLGVDGWIILGLISRRWDVGIWTGLGWPRIETGGGRL